MYLDDERLTSATSQHWTRSETELKWLKNGARKEVIRKLRPRSNSNISFQCHLQLRATEDHLVRELLCEWIDLYISHKKPMAYILGNIPFGDLTMTVRPPILIPRPETEQWVLNLSRQMSSYFQRERLLDIPDSSSSHQKTPKTSRSSYKVLDIGTGSGCISNYLAFHHRCVHSIGIDIDQDAIHLARENATRLKVLHPKITHSNFSKHHTSGRTSFYNLDLFSPTFSKNLKEVSQSLTGFDMIVSNPPYIPHSDYQNLPPSVKNWESSIALVGNHKSTLIQPIPSLSRSNQPTGNYGFFTSYRSTNFVSGTSSSLESSGEAVFKMNDEVNKVPSPVGWAESIESNQDDGLDFYRHILNLISSNGLLKSASTNFHHRSGIKGSKLPRVVFEVGYGQARKVEAMILKELDGIIDRVEIQKDYSGIERVLLAY